MFRLSIILVAALSFVLATPADRCWNLTDPDMLKCCNSLPDATKEEIEMIKECFGQMKTPPSPTSCDAEICYAKKKGIASDDGIIDENALEANVEKAFESNPKLVEAVKKYCVNGDISKYGTKDMCDLLKLNRCILAVTITTCDDLKNSGSCSGLKDLTKDCWNQL